jgi:hypothetical protein
MASPLTAIKFHSTKADGTDNAAGKVYTYAAGTTTPQVTYTTPAAGTPNANPVILDGTGRASIYLDPALAYKFVCQDSLGASVPDGTVDNWLEAGDALRADLIEGTNAANGDALVTVKRIKTGAVAATLHAWIEARDELQVVGEFAAVADGSDQTAKVNTALAALGTAGGTVVIPRGCKFNLQSLTFPKRSNLLYWRGDDTSANRPPGGLDTNERIMFAANSSGTGAGQGIVNEQHFEAAFHPGFIVNVRKDVTGHDAWTGPGQSRTNPARASFLIQDEDTTAFWIKYESYPTYSNFSAATFSGARRVYTLTGVGNTGSPANWGATLPVAGDTITGVTSGAKGIVISLSATQTILLWVSGVFAVGEKLTNGAQTPTNTLSVATYAETAMQPLGYDLTKGNWSVGLPPGSTTNLFSVGGKIASARSRTMSQYIDVTVNDPGYVWLDSYEGAPANGFEAIYDTSVAAASRRLYKRKLNETTNRQMIGSFSAGVNFNNAGTIAVGSFNVTSVGRIAAGRYLVTFVTAQTSATYLVTMSSDDLTLADRDQRVTAKGTGNFEIRNYNAAGALSDLVGTLDVKVHLGDI